MVSCCVHKEPGTGRVLIGYSPYTRLKNPRQGLLGEGGGGEGGGGVGGVLKTLSLFAVVVVVVALKWTAGYVTNDALRRVAPT